jgi:hypothetical protein
VQLTLQRLFVSGVNVLLGFGEETIDQLVPFHRSASVSWFPLD